MERADLDFVTDKRQETRGKHGFGIFEGVLWDYAKLTKRKCRGRGSGRNKDVCVYSQANTKLDQLASRRPWEVPDTGIGQAEGPCAGICRILQTWSARVTSMQAPCVCSEHQAGLAGK